MFVYSDDSSQIYNRIVVVDVVIDVVAVIAHFSVLPPPHFLLFTPHSFFSLFFTSL